FATEESCVPLTVLQQDLVRVGGLALDVQYRWRLLEALQVSLPKLLLGIRCARAIQAVVIDSAVWSHDRFGLLEVLSDDVQQDVDEVAAIRRILNPDRVEQR